MKKRFKFYTILYILCLPLFATEGLDYLNQMRISAKMPIFEEDGYLDQAALNHSNYMQLNNTVGHTEVSGNEGYTADTPSERAVYVGYASRFVSENVSSGNDTVIHSIDSLLSAIYHRFGFLSPQYNQVGIGISEDGFYYTYDMGNSYLEALCEEDSYSGGSYYYNVCADTEKKVDVDAYQNSINTTMLSAPEVIIWPPESGESVAPVFYEEIPDPLPNQSVSGYPVSVEFNSAYFPDPPSEVSLQIFDKNNGILEAQNLNSENDPNEQFSDYQYALFPTRRLEWGSIYYAQLNYTFEGVSEEQKWCFETNSLESYTSKYYKIESNITSISLDVINNESYAYYFIPKDENDWLGGVSYTYTAESVSFDYIDWNTCLIRLTGEEGDYAKFTFDNGIELLLTISDSDTAIKPISEHCIDNTMSIYNITSFYIAYDKNDTTQYVLVMPSVSKIYTHEAGHIKPEDLNRIDTEFETFPTYQNGELCFSALSESSIGESEAALMANQCYTVNFFYIQKDLVDVGMSFMLYYLPQEKLYEGIAGDSDSFKVVRDKTGIYNDASISNTDYTNFIFDIENAEAIVGAD